MDLQTPVRKSIPLLSGMWPEISLFALLVSEWIWAASVFSVFFDLAVRIPMIFVSFAIPGLLSYVLSKALHLTPLSKTVQRLILTGWVIVILVLWIGLFALPFASGQPGALLVRDRLSITNTSALQTLILQVIIFLLIVRRSLTLPAAAANSWQAVRSSQIGLGMFLIFGLTTAWENFFSNLFPFALYLVLMIVSLTTARLAELTADQGGKAPAFPSSWLISIALLASAFVGIACFSGWLVGVVMVDTASAILNFLYLVILAIILILLSPFLLVLIAAIPFLNRLVQNLLAKNFGQKQADFILSIMQPKPGQGEKVFAFMNTGLTIILAIIALLVVIGIIVGVRINRRRRKLVPEDEISELADVQKMLQESRKRSFFTSALDQARRWLASARIRWIYVQLMKACADLNTPRPPSYTPLEFQPLLNTLFPGLVSETTLLTNTYVNIRYGEYPENLEEMKQIHDAWEKVRTIASEMIRERKRRMRSER